MNILFLVSRVPYPLEKGDKLRAYHHLRLLSEKHTVTLVALTDEPVHPDAEAKLGQYCKDIRIIRLTLLSRLLGMIGAFFTGKPLTCGYFFSMSARKAVDSIIEQVRPAHIYCQLTRVCEYVLHVEDVPKTLDYQDAFAKGFERRVDREPLPLRWIFRMEHRRLLKYESLVLDQFENATIISTQDRDFINHPDQGRIAIVSNGVDFDFFRPQQTNVKYDLVFTGNMGYPPNVEGAIYLANEILPRVWKTRPGTNLLVAGATPAAKVQALDSENVHISGWVDDIRDSYASARIFIAPMLLGTGLQNKLLEAMAMQLPCITSELANNALGGTHEQNILICSTPQEYADAIIRLLENPEVAKKLANEGYEFVHKNYGWREATQPLLSLIESQ